MLACSCLVVTSKFCFKVSAAGQAFALYSTFICLGPMCKSCAHVVLSIVLSKFRLSYWCALCFSLRVLHDGALPWFDRPKLGSNAAYWVQRKPTY